VLAPGGIPIVSTDRGGQVTYHAPGQAVAYVMLDLRRRGLGAKELVRRLEQALIDLLAGHDIRGERQAGMPGVYVKGEKIAAIGLRIARGCSYHGVALNSTLDLAPFSRIDPCGYPGLACTSLASLGVRVSMKDLQQELHQHLEKCLPD
jgi:lipoyl(octanoyl) transferase